VPNSAHVTIVGGGVAGCATALALVRRGITNVTVVDDLSNRQTRVGESIPPDTRVLLQRLGIWSDFVMQKHASCLGSCASWGAEELGYNDFFVNPHGMGWHLDRKQFDQRLSQLTRDAGVHWRYGRCEGVEADPDGAHRLRIDGQPWTSGLVVDATGSRAAVARALGASRQVLDRLVFVYGFFDLSEAPAPLNFTLLEAVRDGWWYAAKLPGNRLAVAFGSDPAIIHDANLRERDPWFARLLATRHLAPQLDGARLLDEPLVVRPVITAALDRAGGPGWFAVGDAASVYDPLLAQGIYKALDTGERAGEALAALVGGDPTAPGRYSQSVADDYDAYLTHRAYFYGLEQRWAEDSFWIRRRAAEPARLSRS
jgi:flavin-dependent dehydrogenase